MTTTSSEEAPEPGDYVTVVHRYDHFSHVVDTLRGTVLRSRPDGIVAFVGGDETVCKFADEGNYWIRGTHQEDSDAYRALCAAFLLVHTCPKDQP